MGLMANLARPKGEVAHAVVVVAEGVVQGASAVAEGIATAMEGLGSLPWCYTPMDLEEPKASFPPPSLYCDLSSLSVFFYCHQP